jgi:hypothetical protein
MQQPGVVVLARGWWRKVIDLDLHFITNTLAAVLTQLVTA